VDFAKNGGLRTFTAVDYMACFLLRESSSTLSVFPKKYQWNVVLDDFDRLVVAFLSMHEHVYATPLEWLQTLTFLYIDARSAPSGAPR